MQSLTRARCQGGKISLTKKVRVFSVKHVSRTTCYGYFSVCSPARAGQKNFPKQTVYDHHLKGKKHIKAQERLQASQKSAEANGDANGNGKSDKNKTTAYEEALISLYTEALSDFREETKANVERKQALTDKERTLEQEQEEVDLGEQESDEDDEDRIYNPLKLPLGWDGKPIPYWLYKLHGLGVEYPCEICGNYVYMGRKAFDKHFQEWRHAHGMRCLGIPNSRHFHEITKIDDAYTCKSLRDTIRHGSNHVSLFSFFLFFFLIHSHQCMRNSSRKANKKTSGRTPWKNMRTMRVMYSTKRRTKTSGGRVSFKMTVTNKIMSWITSR